MLRGSTLCADEFLLVPQQKMEQTTAGTGSCCCYHSRKGKGDTCLCKECADSSISAD